MLINWDIYIVLSLVLPVEEWPVASITFSIRFQRVIRSKTRSQWQLLHSWTRPARRPEENGANSSVWPSGTPSSISAASSFFSCCWHHGNFIWSGRKGSCLLVMRSLGPIGREFKVGRKGLRKTTSPVFRETGHDIINGVLLLCLFPPWNPFFPSLSSFRLWVAVMSNGLWHMVKPESFCFYFLLKI